MTVEKTEQFTALLKAVQGNRLKDAIIEKHKDDSGNYEVITLEFIDNNGAITKIAFTSNWEYYGNDRDRIETGMDVEMAMLVFETIKKGVAYK